MSAGSVASPRPSSGPGSRPGSHRVAGSRGSSRESSYEERCVDPVDDRPPSPGPRPSHKADPGDANGRESETIGFIPGCAETPAATPGCNPCASPRNCQTLVCSVLTCGLYRVCRRSVLAPCLAPNESSPDEPEKVSLRATGAGDAGEDDEDDDNDHDADWLGDVRIAGRKVDCPREYLDGDGESLSFVRPPTRQTLQDSVLLDDWEEGGEEDVDLLITKKLLELYSEYQIEALARCTTDSVFLKKSKAINHLINSLAAEHKMDEQEAECRLVRGIIRISTRKSSRRPAVSRGDRTLSDSGNETMRESVSHSFSNNNDYKSNPNIQISEPTSSDKCAREMWRNNGGQPPGSPTAAPPSRSSAVRT